MIDMREGEDGVFRADGPQRPLPYGLPEDPQEPFVAIVAPNIDKVSGVTFDRRTVAGRRSRRGLLALVAAGAGCVAVLGFVLVAQSLMRLLGIE
ncbi:hypothetical protein DOE76_19265 [Leifsonia sp. ku-ls]|nr:hypothetical protein DOE76_19265 [Leifsonia sp. ku-ls]